jgi:hypothetical protein
MQALARSLNHDPSLGQGWRWLCEIYADLTIANVLTESGYVTSRIFVTRTDLGGSRFNVSEILGNAIAVWISNAYYPSDRTARANLEKVSIQLGTDAFSNIVKEFWPDAKQKAIRSPSERAALNLFDQLANVPPDLGPRVIYSGDRRGTASWSKSARILSTSETTGPDSLLSASVESTSNRTPSGRT